MKVRKLAILLAFVIGLPAYGTTIEWANSSGLTVDNWNTNGAWTPEQIPVDGDTVLFKTGTVDVDGYDASTTGLATFWINGYTGDIGDSVSDPLKVYGTKLEIYSGGTHYLAAGTTGEWTDIRVDAPNTTVTFADVDASTCGVTTLIRDGTVTLQEGTFRTVYLEADTGDSPAVTLNIGTIGTCYVRGNDATLSVSGASALITDLYVDSGTVTVTRGTVTNLYQRGGTVTFLTSNALVRADGWAGILDMSRGAPGQVITTMNGHLGWTLKKSNGLTITNANRLGLTEVNP